MVARPPQLSLELLGPHTYSDGRAVLADDAIGETTRDYEAHAAALHREARYRDRVYGHARRDRDGRTVAPVLALLLLQRLPARRAAVGGGKHEGDWELVQFRLGPSEQPEQAVYSQHRNAESRPWSDVRKPTGAPNTPIVYVARGSHANYFRTGSHWTGVWFDQADGRGPAITPTLEILGDHQPRLGALARLVGRHEGERLADRLREPAQPGAAAALARPGGVRGAAAAGSRRPLARAEPPEPPRISVRREDGRVGGGLRGGCRADERSWSGCGLRGRPSPLSRMRSRCRRRAGRCRCRWTRAAYEVWVSAGGSAAGRRHGAAGERQQVREWVRPRAAIRSSRAGGVARKLVGASVTHPLVRSAVVIVCARITTTDDRSRSDRTPSPAAVRRPRQAP